MDIPTQSSRDSIGSSSNGGTAQGRNSISSISSSARPPSYSAGYVMGFLCGSNAYSHYPQQSNVSSVAASYASTSSIMDSMAATEIDSLSSYPFKRSMSVCSFSSTASSFHILPTELFQQIFMYLDTENLKNVVQVSRQWRSAGNPLLWRTMVFPLDKRRLSTMKPVLGHFGHLVRRVIITPPLLDSHFGQGASSRRVSVSSNSNNNNNNSTRSWSLSRPLSRSGSISSQHLQSLQQQQPLDTLPEPGSPVILPSTAPSAVDSLSASTSASNQVAELQPPVLSSFGVIHSGFTSAASSPQTHPANLSHFPPPSPLSLSSSSRQRVSSSSATPLPPDISAAPTPSSGSAIGRHPSRISVGTLPSPILPPIYAVPIPGNPGAGNVLSESRPPSAADSSWGVAGLGAINISSRTHNASSIHSGSYHQNHYQHSHHEVSEGTVLRMHQFMEHFCPNVREAVIKNTAGISSHSRRIAILMRLFQAYPRLEKLNLSDFIMWDPQPLQIVSEQLHLLSSLDVTNRVELSDVDLLPVVENCRRLRDLKIRATNATDSTIHAITANLANSLVSLNVGGCPVSSQAMAELVSKCTKLRILQMWSCLRLDDTFLLALNPDILTSMQVLDMMDVQKFTSEAVHRTFGQQVWPYLKYLRIRAKCSRDDFSGIPERAVLKLNSTLVDE
ncbi:hypothetical protein IW150_001201 [Coemansia sp. RSA 2607]|nr:hypothetical protein IW150_001201 [Coemansia sp. RSA 2607]